MAYIFWNFQRKSGPFFSATVMSLSTFPLFLPSLSPRTSSLTAKPISALFQSRVSASIFSITAKHNCCPTVLLAEWEIVVPWCVPALCPASVNYKKLWTGANSKTLENVPQQKRNWTSTSLKSKRKRSVGNLSPWNSSDARGNQARKMRFWTWVPRSIISLVSDQLTRSFDERKRPVVR